MLFASHPRLVSLVCLASFALLAGCGGAEAPAGDGGTDASAPDDGGNDPSDGATSTLAVEGTVLDQLTGAPVAGASVFVADAAGVISDTSGRFTVLGVTPPYDVAVRASGSTMVRVFEGLTKSAPTLLVDSNAPMRGANVAGDALFSVETSATDRLTCFLAGPRYLGGFTRVTGPSQSPAPWNMSGGGFYDFSARWWGASSVEATAHCYLDRFTDGLVSASFHGALGVTLADGGTFPDVDVTLASAPLATVSGNIHDPVAEASVVIAAGPALEDGTGYSASDVTQAPGAYSRVVPYVPGSFVFVSVTDATITRRSVALVPAGATVNVDLALLPRPTLIAPASGASGVLPTAPVTWDGGDGHVFLLYVVLADDTVVQVFTTRESVVLPDIARFGLAYGAGSTTVRVTEYSATSVDALAEGMDLILVTTGRTTVQTAGSAMHTITFAN